jgi:hypothetical protein
LAKERYGWALSLITLEYEFSIKVRIDPDFYPPGATNQDVADIEIANIRDLPEHVHNLFRLNQYHCDIKVGRLECP